MSAQEVHSGEVDPLSTDNGIYFVAQPSFGVIPPQSDDSHIQIVQDSYIQAYNSPTLPKFKDLGFAARLFGPTSEIIFLPGDENPINAGQCVNYVKYVLGNKAVNYSGNAEDWQRFINSTEPSMYSIVVLNMSAWGHVGFIIAYDAETVTIRSRNWEGKWIVSDNILSRDDARILGYIIH